MQTNDYPFVVEPNEKGTFYVYFPDLPTIFTGGVTIEEAVKNAQEALAGHITMLQELGRRVPTPPNIWLRN